MRFNIVHVISNLEPFNFGIWNAAVAGSSFLSNRHEVETQLWVCDVERKSSGSPGVPVRWLGNETDSLKKNISTGKWLIENSIIVTHGCWLQPTRIGFELKQMGFPWIYVPHGMLEPWSMRQGRLKKQIYYFLLEKRMANAADAIRAVSTKEQQNLQIRFKQKVELIENGVEIPQYAAKDLSAKTFLFLGRLHHKKGILPLVRAWRNIMHDSDNRLVIAGPDEGELEKIKSYINHNIEYVGPAYGEDKVRLLRGSHYFLLPSHSEGFPTSVVEAMSFGMIPLISKGCNFPEVFTNELGYLAEPTIESIEKVLEELKGRNFDPVLSQRNHTFIRNNYSTDRIGEKLYRLYDGVRAHEQSIN